MKKIIIIFWLCVSSVVLASENKTEKAILHMITKGFPQFRILPRPNHPLVFDNERRQKIVEAIDYAHIKYPRVPKMVLVVIAFREGSFLGNKRGLIGERSTFQMLKKTAAIVQKFEPECNLTTYRGSATCAAAWLDHWTNRCGSLQGALSIYASGRSCKPKTRKVDWIVYDRMRLARALEKTTQ